MEYYKLLDFISFFIVDTYLQYKFFEKNYVTNFALKSKCNARLVALGLSLNISINVLNI